MSRKHKYTNMKRGGSKKHKKKHNKTNNKGGIRFLSRFRKKPAMPPPSDPLAEVIMSSSRGSRYSARSGDITFFPQDLVISKSKSKETKSKSRSKKQKKKGGGKKGTRRK